jgi:tryptophan-rich sensory protein
MNRMLASKILLSVVLGGGSLMSFVLDWSSNHLLNPLWHPHARFHGAALLFLFAGVAATALWLMWRDSREPKVAITAAAMLSASYWMPFFYVPLLLPQASWWAGTPGHEPRVWGMLIYPNLVVVGLCLLITVVGWRMGIKSSDLEAG